MDTLFLLAVFGGLLALAWSLALLLYVARIHYQLRKASQETANLLRGILRALNAGDSTPAARPASDSGWYQDESGEWHQAEESEGS